MREHLRGVGIANRIRLARDAHAGAFLIVEGEDDKRLFQQFIDRAACKIQIAHGKPNLLEALKILEEDGFRGVLAIADADFSRLDHLLLHSPNLLWTDTHDLETMLLRSPALERLLVELGDEAKLQAARARYGVDLRLPLLLAGARVGYLRWLSGGEGMGLLFDDLPFEGMLARNSIDLDDTALLQTLQNRSRKSVLIAAEIQQKVSLLEALEPDPWQLCCGHDLVRILSCALCRLLGSNKEADVKPERLEMSLRLAYARSDFEQTSLWAAVIAWEGRNPPFIVLAR